MATFSGLISDSSGIKTLAPYASIPKFPSRNLCKLHRFGLHRKSISFLRRTPNLQMQSFHSNSRTAHVLSSGRDYQLNYSEEYHNEPFWSNLIREAIWSIRGLVVFLAEQPSQLKYIEWPSFQNTLKTAILTLVLVAILIIALSSVDSGLSFLLALVLRNKA